MLLLKHNAVLSNSFHHFEIRETWKHTIDFHLTAYNQNPIEQSKMEEVFERFPYLLCRQIFSELDNDYLTKCREVSRDWRLAVDSQRILMMQRYTKCSRKLLKKILRKEDLVDLANQTRKLYEKYPITSSKNRMMPLHEAAKIGNLSVSVIKHRKISNLNYPSTRFFFFIKFIESCYMKNI